ncbi:hypothetical protein [Roseixanthobacter pseudopolyaromaticivorans]|uniref:hypothetical protein n=1 Tax=Xanthobacteraceae TaxID=335928 RepID=UPI003727962B
MSDAFEGQARALHTPAPCSVATYDPRVVLGSNGQKLGRAHINGDRLLHNEAVANARLWAAAPAMAEELSKLRARAEAAEAERDRLAAACRALVEACDNGPPLQIVKNVGAACDLARAALSSTTEQS